MRNLLVLLTIGGLQLLLAGPAIAVSPLQEETPKATTSEATTSQTSKSQHQSELTGELPKHAIARLGEFGEGIEFNGVYAIRYSPDGKLIATRMRDHSIRVFEVESGKLLCEINGHEIFVGDLRFSPDSQVLVSAGDDPNEKIKFWKPTTGELISELDSNAHALQYSAGGKKLLAAAEKELSLIDVETGEFEKILNWKKENRNTIFLAIAPDGKKIATTRMTKTPGIEVRGTRKNDSSIFLYGTRVLRNQPFKGAAFSSNGRWVAGRFHRQKTAFLWDVGGAFEPHDSDPLKTHALETDDSILHIAFSPDSRFLATCGWDHKVILWDTLTASKIGEFVGHDWRVNSAEFSGDSRRLATGTSGKTDCSTIIWDTFSIAFPEKDHKPFDDSQLVEIWKQLGAAKVRPSLDAVETITRNPDSSLSFIADHVKSTTQMAVPGQIEELIAQLDSPKYKIRAAAQDKLLTLRSAAETLLQRTLELEDVSVEARYRINTILRHPIERPKIAADELRRMYRVVFAMEIIDSEKSREILTNLARGHQHSYISREAAGALERLDKAN